MDKLVQKKLRTLAGMLPAKAYATSEQQEIKGEDLLLCGHKEVKGEAIDPEKTYFMKMPVYNEMNHYRRMKKVFLQLGRDGLKRYLRPFVTDHEASCKAIDIIFPEWEGRLIKATGLRVKS